MIFKNYYKILGLEKNIKSTQEEIKSAYRTQAKKYHPDVNVNNKNAEERFKDINEAYKVLSDFTQKKKYDRSWYYYIGKKIQKEKSYSLYIKDGEEISKFLAFIGANSAVLNFEENRVVRDTRNNVNRLINCETANLAKTIKASQKQIEDIKFIKSKHKFSELPENLKIVANIRLEHPDASLTDLVNLLGNTISKSGMCHRLTALSKIANELRDK